MFNIDEFNAALANGTNPDEIAKAFTETLNAAVKAKEEKDKKTAAAAKAKANRIADLEEIIDYVLDYIEEYYPDMYTDDLANIIDAAELDQAIENSYQEVKKMGPLFEALKDLDKATVKVDLNKNIDKKYKKKTTDDIISDFLRSNML